MPAPSASALAEPAATPRARAISSEAPSMSASEKAALNESPEPTALTASTCGTSTRQRCPASAATTGCRPSVTMARLAPRSTRATAAASRARLRLDQPGLVHLLATHLDDVRPRPQGHQQSLPGGVHEQRTTGTAAGLHDGRVPVGLDACRHAAGHHGTAALGQQLILQQSQEGRELLVGGRAGPLVDDDRGAAVVDRHVGRARLGLCGGPVRVEPLGGQGVDDPATRMPAGDARGHDASPEPGGSASGVDALAAGQGHQLDGPQDLTVDDAPDVRRAVDGRAGRDAEQRRAGASPRARIGAPRRARRARGSVPGRPGRGSRRAPILRSRWLGPVTLHHPLRALRPRRPAPDLRGGRCRTGGRRRRPGRAGCSPARSAAGRRRRSRWPRPGARC